MPSPRISLTSSLVVVLILAADFAWLRWLLVNGHRSLLGLSQVGLDLGMIPSISALAMTGSLLASRREGGKAFLVGFTIFGSVALIAYSACCLIAPETILGGLRSIEPVLNRWSGAGLFRRILTPLENTIFHDPSRGRFDLWEVAWVMALLSLPQALVALVAGFVASGTHRPSVRG